MEIPQWPTFKSVPKEGEESDPQEDDKEEQEDSLQLMVRAKQQIQTLQSQNQLLTQQLRRALSENKELQRQLQNSLLWNKEVQSENHRLILALREAQLGHQVITNTQTNNFEEVNNQNNDRNEEELEQNARLQKINENISHEIQRRKQRNKQSIMQMLKRPSKGYGQQKIFAKRQVNPTVPNEQLKLKLEQNDEQQEINSVGEKQKNHKMYFCQESEEKEKSTGFEYENSESVNQRFSYLQKGTRRRRQANSSSLLKNHSPKNRNTSYNSITNLKFNNYDYRLGLNPSAKCVGVMERVSYCIPSRNISKMGAWRSNCRNSLKI